MMKSISLLLMNVRLPHALDNTLSWYVKHCWDWVLSLPWLHHTPLHGQQCSIQHSCSGQLLNSLMLPSSLHHWVTVLCGIRVSWGCTLNFIKSLPLKWYKRVSWQTGKKYIFNFLIIFLSSESHRVTNHCHLRCKPLQGSGNAHHMCIWQRRAVTRQ